MKLGEFIDKWREIIIALAGLVIVALLLVNVIVTLDVDGVTHQNLDNSRGNSKAIAVLNTEVDELVRDLAAYQKTAMAERAALSQEVHSFDEAFRAHVANGRQLLEYLKNPPPLPSPSPTPP